MRGQRRVDPSCFYFPSGTKCDSETSYSCIGRIQDNVNYQKSLKYIRFAISAISFIPLMMQKCKQKISDIRNTPLVKLTFFMWKTLQIFSTITYSYSLLATCGTHGSCVVVFLYDWHNIGVDTLFLWQFFALFMRRRRHRCI